MSEVWSRRVYTFKPRYDHQFHLGAAEIRNAVIDIGEDVLGSEFEVEIISVENNQLEIRCVAATGKLVYEMDTRLLIAVLNFCEKNNLDFSVEEMEVKTTDMDDYV